MERGDSVRGGMIGMRGNNVGRSDEKLLRGTGEVNSSFMRNWREVNRRR